VPRRTLNLNGADWQLGQAPPGASPRLASWTELDQIREWFPARVPGNVRADLVQAGKLSDLTSKTAVERSRWVDNHCWWLVRDFALETGAEDRVQLVLRGVDYISEVFVNGQSLGRHEGMFSPQTYDITSLAAPHNQVAVRLLGSRWLPTDRSTRWARLLNHLETRFVSLAPLYPHRRDSLKCQMGFGWDFAPAALTMGLWDDVYVLLSDQVVIQEVWVRPCLEAEEARLIVKAHLDAIQAQTVRLRCVVTGETFETDPLVAEEECALPSGSSRQRIELRLAQPRLWWPWDHGQPDLYALGVEVWHGDRLLDAHTQSFGLRQVTWDAATLQVNGSRTE
jgi:beta-mannosidase